MNEILKKVETKQLKPKEAYQKLYPKQPKPKHKYRKAHFAKLSIKIPESKGVTIFLKMLFALPIPIAFVQPFIKRGIQKNIDKLEDISYDNIIQMIKTRGVSLNIKTSDGVKIRIRTI